ncbi:hypothetical protein HHJ78_07810 [Mobiluncus mulieris]|uniref:Uncharacterized protein n=1 Tax=Mobiluncus mulieris TaxID=2052 RepID=A0A7Y0Y4S1_9ACTO|nr:hypothetical protein [Mobiluncus mulieris]NMW65432.1 hypothetical protein [Mobiluncus mulieris]
MISRFRLISGIFAALLASSAFAIPSYAYPTDEIESLRTQQAQTLRVDNGIVSIGLQFDFTGVGGGYGSTISNPRGPWSRGVLTSCSYPQIVHHMQKHTASGPASVTLTAQCNNVLGSTTHYAQFRHEYAKFTQDIW